MKYSHSRGLVVVLFVGITFAYPMLAPTAHWIDETHFVLIKEGMAIEQVKAIFGVPAGSYDGAEPVNRFSWDWPTPLFNSGSKPPIVHVERHTHLEWVGRNGRFLVVADEEGRELYRNRSSVRFVPPWERLSRWWKSK